MRYVIIVIAMLLACPAALAQMRGGVTGGKPIVVAIDAEAPSVPQSLTAMAVSDTQINLSWEASTDNVAVDRYEYRVDGGSPIDVGNVTSAQVTGLTPSTQYAFDVRACDAADNCSAFSSVVNATTDASGQVAVIPSGASFTDRGAIIAPGAAGSWDARLHGMITPCGVVRVGTDLILYYLGADGNRADGGPANRKLGAAILADGSDVASGWTKYGLNPLITHQPDGGHGNVEEEGVFSCSTFWDGDSVEMMFGGMESVSSSGVDGDGVHVSLGADGLTPGSQTDILDGTVIVGDELFPVGLYEDSGGTWWSFFNVGGAFPLRYTSGASIATLDQSAGTITEIGSTAYTASDPVDIGGGNLAYPLFRNSTNDVEVWSGAASALPSIGTLQQTWDFSSDVGPTTGQDMVGIVLHRDTVRDQWLFFYVNQSFTNIYLKTAPVTYE